MIILQASPDTAPMTTLFYFLLITVVVIFLFRKRKKKKQVQPEINSRINSSTNIIEKNITENNGTPKKEVNVDKTILKSIGWGFIIALLSVIIIQHNGEIQGRYNMINDGYDYMNNKTKWKTGEWYAESFNSPFGYVYKINIPAKKLYHGNETDNYFTKLGVYISASFSHFQYILYFWIPMSGIIFFFRKYKLKFHDNQS